MRFRAFAIIGLAATLCLGTPAFSQTEEAEEREDNGFLIGLVEDQLSTEYRKIRLSGVEGVLSSQATVRRITISDPEGVWLQIDNAVIDWNRRRLVLSRELSINSIGAEKITIKRNAIPEPSLPEPVATPFAIPELPVSVAIEALRVDKLVLGEPVIGLAAEIRAEGGLTLAGGALETTLSMERLDGPGGNFDLTANIGGDPVNVDVRLIASEPENGVFAELLDIPGRPPVEARVSASGTLDDLQADLDFSANGQSLLDGQITAQGQDDGGRAFTVALAGRLQSLIPEEFHAFFSEESRINAVGRQLPEGGVSLDRLTVESGGLSLAGSLRTAPDGFPQALELDAQMAPADGTRLILPVGAGETSVTGATLRLSYGNGSAWNGALRMDGLDLGDVGIGTIDVQMDGLAQNLANAEARRVTAQIDGLATGFSAEDPAVLDALGEQIALDIDIDWSAGEPIRMPLVRLAGNGMNIGFGGALDGARLTGKAEIAVDDLGVLAAVSGRDLAGSFQTSAEGEVNLLSRGFRLLLDGSAGDLALGVAQLDPLLRGVTTLEGQLVRDTRGFEADDFRLGNEQVQITADGIYAPQGTDFEFEAALTDLGLVTDAGSGALTLTGTAAGGTDSLSLSTALLMPEGRLQGREVRNMHLAIDATGARLDRLNGQITGNAALDGTPVELGGQFSLADGVQRLKGFSFQLGRTEAGMTLARGADGLIAGTVSLFSPDLSEPAALFLTEASGGVDAEIVLSRSLGQQRADVDALARNLEVAGARLGRADIDVIVTDLFGLPLADGTVSARRVEAAGQRLERLDVALARADQSMDVEIDGALDGDTSFDLAGRLENLRPGLQLDLSRLTLDTRGEDAVLIQPSRVVMRNGAIDLSPLLLSIGDGGLQASGRVGERLELDFRLSQLPLGIANAVVDGLGLTGQATGTASLTGTPGAPNGAFDLAILGVGTDETRRLGLPPVDLRAEGQTVGNAVTVEADFSAANALAINLAGTVPFDPQARTLDLSIVLEQLDLATFDQAAGSQGLTGRLTGTADVTGATGDPRAVFALNSQGLSLRANREIGIASADLVVNGSYASGALVLDQADIQGPAGMNMTARGRVPFAGPGLNLSAAGQVPLGLANVVLASSQSQLDGSLSFDVTARGRLSNPQVNGQLTVAGGTFVNAPANLRLNGIDVAASLSGTRLTISQAGATSAQGGALNLQGFIDINPAQRFPANLQLGLRDLVYTDGDILTAQVSGDLALVGPITGAGLLSGEVNLRRAEISIPSSFGINAGVLLDVQHRAPPRNVQLTLDRAGLNEPLERERASAPMGLDILVRAPNRIFVRGRGMDAELGGEVRVRGTLADVQPVGAIEMIRGRLSILGQRFDFDEGTITLEGNLVPRLRFVVETESADGTTILITVSGPATDPQITFTSSPDLPQDEVLAQLIFNRNVSELSAFQIAQLAGAAATLAGGGGGGVAGQFRSAIGLDNLDITTGEEGEVGVRAGAYINDNLYLDVEADSAGDSKATINLDITTGVRARASVDNRGESTVGIFFERDY
ncbi:translocation/assembly module TamB domain-containing protein [Oceanibium sediminis]|uniref:translocation/assembly module TamB domain-containing protein n=1 Tax=Oceanibium sediminis TaxID=2026339 RepID=UPI000DD4565A|nr:translocation/assembly module TamB domain-containing protein [Oceanibium sediminis]